VSTTGASSVWGLGKARPAAEPGVSLASWYAVCISFDYTIGALGLGLPLTGLEGFHERPVEAGHFWHEPPVEVHHP